MMEGAVYNPRSKPVEELPYIYGFNNGGSPGFMSAALLAQDGTGLGGHLCSHEAYMPHDLGVIEGSRPDRHEGFRSHYPDGYRMVFIGYPEVMTHPGIDEACRLNRAQHEAAQGTPTRSAETTGSVGEADGGPVAESDAPNL